MAYFKDRKEDEQVPSLTTSIRVSVRVGTRARVRVVYVEVVLAVRS